MESTTLIGISTLLSDVNFYTRLMRIKDKMTGGPLFTILQIQLACQACIECGKAAECVHMLHLVPRWQSSGRHEMLRTVMAEIPSLVESELAGLAFDSATTVFKPALLDIMFTQTVPQPVINEDIFLFIDPAAGGANSDYAILSITRQKGIITVYVDRVAPCEAAVRCVDESREDPEKHVMPVGAWVFFFIWG